jgi:hypothetical protein
VIGVIRSSPAETDAEAIFIVGIIDPVMVVDSTLPWELPHPAVRTQMTTIASAAVGWHLFRLISVNLPSPGPTCPPKSVGVVDKQGEAVSPRHCGDRRAG